MSTIAVLIFVLLLYAIAALTILFRWLATNNLQKELYPKYIADGSLGSGVGEDEFARMFRRVEGPRLGLYTLIGAVIAPFAIILGMRIFNVIWALVWARTGELPWFEIGELPHSLMLVFLCVAILFGLAWGTMRAYYLHAPGSFKAEMKRLNGET